MPTEREPDLSLFLDILQTLERLEIPYAVIGAFAGAVYGVTRVTYDIDMIVDLREDQIDALSETYPLPRYYADPEMIRNSIAMGIMFNIIDTNRGEKADLQPLTSTSPYFSAFQRRVRQLVEIPGAEPFEIWCARPEDVIYGKLLAWEEGRSRKHETDIYDMMVFHYLKADPAQSAIFDEECIDRKASSLGSETLHLWKSIKAAAQQAVRSGKTN